MRKLCIIIASIAACMIVQFQSISCSAREIAPEDLLEITVYGHEDLSTKTRVSSEGTISFPLLGTINVEGKTVRDLETEIEKLLNKDYIVNPHVVVLTLEYYLNQLNIIYIIGEVKNPTTINLTKNKVTNILEAISMAGGFTDEANKRKIEIIRIDPDGVKKKIIVNLSSILKKQKKGNADEEDETAIKPGDVIMVPARLF